MLGTLKLNVCRFRFVSLATLLILGYSIPSVNAQIAPLSDTEMSNSIGQAAFYTAYTPPSGTGNGSNTSDFGFFTLGLNAELDINANIRHIQLGCGGVNGSGCDIDMNNVTLSGNPGVGSCPSGASLASCDAVITNPFIRLAVLNPNSLSTRQIAGVQLGAQNLVGLLQSGDNTTSANGINSFSGYLHVQSTTAADTLTGTISTSPTVFPVYNPGSGAANYTIHGSMTAAGGLAATAGFYLSSGSINIPGFSGINFSVPGPTVNGSRITALTVNTTAGLPNVILGYTPDDNTCGAIGTSACGTYGTPTYNSNFSASGATGTYPVNGSVGTQGGPVVATTTSCSGIGCILLKNGGVNDNFNIHLYGAMQNISSNVAFTQPLGFVHSMSLNSPVSLSLQSQNILWPDAPSGAVAQPGWWVSVNKPVYLGNLVPSNPINLCADATNASSCVFPQFAQQFNAFLASNPPNSNNIAGLLTGSTLGVQIGVLNMTPIALALNGVLNMTPIALALNGVQLSNQGTFSNCYGSLKFC